MADNASGTVPLTDSRIAPRGVLPRNAQTYLMLAVAVGILAIIVLTGKREPDSRPAPTATTPAATGLNPERLRDYQDRLRTLDDRARQSANEPQVERFPARVPYEE